jgi:molybdopterin-guanine dinucleotide biosynthesis protein MobB
LRSLDELLRESSTLHGHCCAGQIVGVRMAMIGCREVDIEEPKGCKKLIVCVEMDRCATDAIQAVTGCSLGRRTLKFFDYGKMAATFINLEAQKAVRVVARDDARTLASAYCPDAANPHEAQKKAYGIMPEGALFSLQAVSPNIAEENLPGFRSSRVYCDNCGEGINFRREIHTAGRILCIPCAGAECHSNGDGGLQNEARAPVLLIVGFKKVGKTRLLENLISELSSRGHRVACIKHHHSDAPVVVDACDTDTWRFRKAGAKSVVLVTPSHIASFHDTSEQPALEQVLQDLTAIDLVLGEGFHAEPHLKIEVVSASNDNRLCRTDKNLIALVKTTEGVEAVPTFAPESIKPLADFIEVKILRKRRGTI